MKHLLLIALALLTAVAAVGQSSNIISYELGGYATFVPKYSLPGNKYHPFLNEVTSASQGLSYERLLTERHSLHAGVFLNQQHSVLISLYVPVNYRYCFFQLPQARLRVGGTVGLTLNKQLTVTHYSGDLMMARLMNSGVDLDVQLHIKKGFYAAPHAGLWASVRVLKRLGLSAQALYHYPVPEYLDFVTAYKNPQGQRVVEHNTNKRHGITLMAGLQVWVGKLSL